ncbi:MAG: glycine--tRNA ligase subunit beta [Rhodospirillales bacterium]|nr:glycine--tRNA ligase subunit beta [Rhodospirillales bacterium]
MPDLLFELLSEEIPARMQARAAEDLARIVGAKLEAAGLGYKAARSYVTPRRLTLVVEGLPEAQADVTEERRGPRVDAPEKAIEGFLKAAGLGSLAECEKRDTGKGVFWLAVIRKSGRPTAEVLPGLLREAVYDFPWPKSMRFPAAPFRWVRPLQSVLCLFGGKVLPIELGSVPVGDTTEGHRFLAGQRVRVKDFADYRAKLSAASVVLDPVERRQKILEGLEREAGRRGLRLKDDPALLDEVTGLVEYPVVLAGRIDDAFMDVPPEVLTTSMRAHQKYFACLGSDGKLAPHFLLVANTTTSDNGAAVVAGNERVLRARLSDAKFFWDQDRKVPLESRVPKLAERIFHAKLGTVLDKVRRVEALAEALVPFVPGAEKALARRAALLAKADLSSGMVGEFPELQGVMGAYYARHDGEDEAVAAAVAEHYSPLGPSDRCPTAPVSIVVALADKIDSLAAFFSIDEKPTGSKDPYALRRAALGVIRLILENRLRVPLAAMFDRAAELVAGQLGGGTLFVRAPGWSRELSRVAVDLLGFFADRLEVHLREKGVRHDLIDAVFSLGGEDDLVRLLSRVAALGGFLESEDGANLLVAYRRASNIVRIEEKRDGRSYDEAPDPALLDLPEEKALFARLGEARHAAGAALAHEEFERAMAALAALRRPVDEFFDRVTVNAPEAELRANRLRLLSEIRATLGRVADFSRIEG